MSPPAAASLVSVAPLAPSARPAQGAVSFTEVRCPNCNRHLMSIPGRVIAEPRIVQDNGARSGRGRVVHCKRCKSLVEVVEHG